MPVKADAGASAKLKLAHAPNELANQIWVSESTIERPVIRAPALGGNRFLRRIFEFRHRLQFVLGSIEHGVIWVPGIAVRHHCRR
jgi:hypothetical protein